MSAISKGTTLGYCTTLAGTYTFLGEVSDVSGPNVTVRDVETIHYASTAVERKPILPDYGEVSLTVQYAKAQTDTLYTQIGVSQFFQIVEPDTSKSTFAGYIKGLSHERPVLGNIEGKITIAISGAVDFVPVA